MAILPSVRYMLLSEDLRINSSNPHLVDIIGLLTNLVSLEEPPFPLRYPELCVFLTLTEGRGQGTS